CGRIVRRAPSHQYRGQRDEARAASPGPSRDRCAVGTGPGGFMTAGEVAPTRDQFDSFPASGTRSGAVAVRGCSGKHGNAAPDTLRDSKKILVRFLWAPPPR